MKKTNALLLLCFSVTSFGAKTHFYCSKRKASELDAELKSILSHIPGKVGNIEVCSKNNKDFMVQAKIGGQSFIFAKDKVWQSYTMLNKKNLVYNVKITSSFFKDGIAAGVPVKLLHQAENMFKERFRFDKELKKNDLIKLLVEHKGTNDILVMASIIQKQKHITAMRFLNYGKPGFYDDHGRALVDGFDRVPIKYKRISSPFRLKRKHPILGYVRPHKGVDLAAPSGTPIHATSSGTVVSVGALRGYGRTVIIKHKGNYQTLYAHMHAYAKGIKAGDHVHRKQLIGYVGMTGLATAPHCHYEFIVGNVPHDPMKVKLPNAERLTGARLAIFKSKWYSRYKLLQG